MSFVANVTSHFLVQLHKILHGVFDCALFPVYCPCLLLYFYVQLVSGLCVIMYVSSVYVMYVFYLSFLCG